MTSLASPLIIDGPAPAILPASPLPAQEREARPLYVVERTIYRRTLLGWQRIPRGYVTDFASQPGLAMLLSLGWLQPLAAWAWAALSHDFGYAVGEPGLRKSWDEVFRELMVVDKVNPLAREIMFRAVRIGGAGGYAEAPNWWATENFADPDTGAYPVKPLPFRREEAFAGQRWGLRPSPDWIEARAA